MINYTMDSSNSDENNMLLGIEWDREIPNELLYLSVCSFIQNNPEKTFIIICKNENAFTLMKCFIERLDNDTSNKINIIHPKQDNFENIFRRTTIIQVNSIFIKKINSKTTTLNYQKLEGNIFIKNSDSLHSITNAFLYLVEEEDIDIITYEPQWDNFYMAYNSKTIVHYFWKKYVNPFLKKDVRPCFSFCLYGDNSKYSQGFLNNLPLIKQYFPNFGVSLWIRSDSCFIIENIIKKVKEVGGDEFLSRVLLFEIRDINNKYLMLHRIFLENHWYPTEIYSRDTDSRINFRDATCIKDFQESNKDFHIVRDHYWHKMRIMGGMFGMKKLNTNIIELFENWKQTHSNPGYGSDEQFLSQVIYPMYKKRSFLQTNIVTYLDEVSYPIRHNLNETGTDFIGNSFKEDDNAEFSYNSYPFSSHIDWLLSNSCSDGDDTKGAGRCLYLLKRKIIELSHRDALIWIIKNEIFRGNLSSARLSFQEFEYIPPIDESILINTVIPYLRKYQSSGGKIFFTTSFDDAKHIANKYANIYPSEYDLPPTIVLFGNYPYGVWNLPNWRNKIDIIKWPVILFELLEEFWKKENNNTNNTNTEWYFSDCWNKIERIYILNLVDRKDRWAAMLSELCKMNAPLHRIFHYKALKADPPTKLEIYSGATKNHVDCVKNFIDFGGEYCLILEDDLEFCSSYEENKNTLRTFFERNYDFDICMISYSKDGTVLFYDDLLSISRQPCTTSSGYILRRETAKKIYDILEEGYVKMRETGDYIKYCCDRYWASLQVDNKFFLLKNKIAYQRITYSNITGCNNFHLD